MTRIRPTSAAPEPEFISRQVARAQRFYLPAPAGERLRLRVVCGGWEDCASDYCVDRADFPYHSIEFVDAGRGTLSLAGRAHALCRGAIFSYGPGIAHRIATDPSERLRKYFVDFDGPGAGRALRAADLAAGTASHRSPALLHDLFELLIGLGRGGAEHREACRLQLEVMLAAIGAQPPQPSGEDSLAFATFERCRAHLDADFLTIQSVKAAAAACQVDAAYLCRLFQRFTRDSPYRYLIRLRMNWAADRLHDGRSRVKDIADELGIDPFQFSRSFKRVHGVPPARFAGRHAAR